MHPSEAPPKPMTSNAKAEGRFGKQDFRYVADEDVYVCPAGEKLAYSFTTQDKGMGPASLPDRRLYYGVSPWKGTPATAAWKRVLETGKVLEPQVVEVRLDYSVGLTRRSQSPFVGAGSREIDTMLVSNRAATQPEGWGRS